MQTYKDRDPAVLRTRNLSESTIQVMAEEETSKNSNVTHKKEVVGYLIIGSASE